MTILSKHKNNPTRTYLTWQRKVKIQIDELNHMSHQQLRDKYLDPHIEKLLKATGRKNMIKDQFKLPPGKRAACHICNPTEYFLDMEGCIEHKRLKHDLKG